MLQESKGGASSITFEQFSKLLRLPVPENLDKSGGLARDMLVHKFVKKLKDAVAQRRDADAAAAAAAAAAPAVVPADQGNAEAGGGGGPLEPG